MRLTYSKLGRTERRKREWERPARTEILCGEPPSQHPSGVSLSNTDNPCIELCAVREIIFAYTRVSFRSLATISPRDMIVQRPLAGSSHLRESYIEISNYVRRRLLQQSPGLRNGPKPAPFGQRRLLAGAATKEVEQTNSNRNKAAVSGINIKTQRISQVTKEQYRILTHFERSSMAHLP